MAPPAAATARRTATRSDPRPAPSGPRRPPLRLFEPAPRRQPSRRGIGRSSMWLSCLLVVGSLFAVVVSDAFVAEGQVRLSATQGQVAAATAAQKALQVAVAEKAAPPVVVSQAKRDGMVIPDQVVYLPQVPLDVPLPAPHTTPTAPARR
ncbi:MAG: hypothetical protein ACLQPH_18290 [Acidimicrobiales bacterium]